MQTWISGGDYAWGLAKRFCIFAVITLAFPFFVYGIVEMSGARNVGGASGALALVLGLYLKPIIYLWFVCSTLRISLKRAKTIGISPAIGLCIPLLILADFSFGLTVGSFWAVGFTLGIMASLLPASLLAAVIAIVTLSLLREIENPATARMMGLYGIWKALLFVLLGLGLIGIFPILSAWFLGPGAMKLSVQLIQATSHLRSLFIYPYGLLAAFGAASAALILESRRSGSADDEDRTPRTSRTPAPLFGRKT